MRVFYLTKRDEMYYNCMSNLIFKLALPIRISGRIMMRILLVMFILLSGCTVVVMPTSSESTDSSNSTDTPEEPSAPPTASDIFLDKVKGRSFNYNIIHTFSSDGLRLSDNKSKMFYLDGDISDENHAVYIHISPDDYTPGVGGADCKLEFFNVSDTGGRYESYIRIIDIFDDWQDMSMNSFTFID